MLATVEDSIMLVDSHCHLNRLDLKEYQGDLGKLLEEARLAGVAGVLCVAVDLETAPEVLAIAEQFDNVWASVGLHPSHDSEPEPVEQDYVELASHPKVVALGEMGLDYHYNHEYLDRMRDRFRCQIRAAIQIDKPIIVHTRAACEDTLQIMREENAAQVGGVMHCFTESWEMADAAMAMGFYISISGIVTFKNAGNVAAVAKQVPIDRLLIETDAPYLTPIPYRGKPNRPQYVRYVAECIAELRQIDVNTVIQQTADNFFRLFKQAKRV